MKTPYEISKSELLASLAEECTEMAQAALKLRRALNGGENPTPFSKSDCITNLIEEHADVCNCLKALKWDDKEQREVLAASKWKRWEERLNR